MKKIDLLENNFSKAELFLQKLLPVIERSETPLLGGQGGTLLDPMRASAPDNSTIEILKVQHKKSLIMIKEFYSKCESKLAKLTQEIKEHEEML